MKSWPILLAVMLLALTTNTLGNFDANTLDKDENQVKTQSLDVAQDEEHGSKCKWRSEGRMIGKLKNWARNKFKKFVQKIINKKLELDDYSLSAELKKKLIEEILTALTDIWKDPNKRISENMLKIYQRYVSGTVTTGPEEGKPVESGNP